MLSLVKLLVDKANEGGFFGEVWELVLYAGAIWLVCHVSAWI